MMVKDTNYKFDEQFVDFLKEMRKEMENYNLKRISPIIMFKCLLDEKESIIYELFCENWLIPYPILEEEIEYQVEKVVKIQENDKDPVENKLQLQKVDEEDEEMTIVFDQAAYTALYVAKQLADAYKVETISTENLLIALIATMPKELLKLFRGLGINPAEVSESFGIISEKALNTTDVEFLPEELKNFTHILNEGINKKKKCEILGRDKECENIWRVLEKMNKRNVILIGEPGVGKSAIGKKITNDIVNNRCPEMFKGFKVVSLNVNDIISGTTLRGQAEERFKFLVEFIQEREDIILFIDEIHMIMKAGGTRDDDSTNLANALKPILADSNVRVIGTTTEVEYEKHIKKDSAMERRFKVIRINEPKAAEVYPMLKYAIRNMSKYHGVKITKQMVEFAVLIANCFRRNGHNPDKTKDVIDEAMVIAKNECKKSVDKETILKVFDTEISKYNKMDKESRKYFAYHEAGHYIVWRFSDKLKNIDVLAVSIIPVGESGGVNIFEETDEIIYADMSYFIDDLALDFGGRVGEEVFTKEISSSVVSDSQNATKRAYDIVTKYGMGKYIGKDRVYFDDETRKMFNEKVVEQINSEVDELCKKGKKRAEEIINAHKDLLIKLAEELMEKDIMSKNDLDKFFEKHLKN